MAGSPNELSGILKDYNAGVPGARDRLVEAIWDELRENARSRLAEARNRANPLLQPTMVANDTMMKLLQQRKQFTDSKHLLATAAMLMKRVLTDYQRQDWRQPRGVDLPEDSKWHPAAKPEVELMIEFHEAWTVLQSISRRAAEIVALRTVSGQTIEEVALALGVGHATVERQSAQGLREVRKRLGVG